jgi:protein-tyrosine phosphatase
MTEPRTGILLVCTANQCRSPLAAAIATRDAAGLPVQFDSAGLIEGGHRTPTTGIRVAAELGLDLSHHVSQQVDLSSAADYAVVLTMTREQARELVADAPALWPRVFTLKQFARWLRDHPYPGGIDLRSWLGIEAEHRTKLDLVGANRDDDVRDPLRSSARVWRYVADDLETHLQLVLRALYPTD